MRNTLIGAVFALLLLPAGADASDAATGPVQQATTRLFFEQFFWKGCLPKGRIGVIGANLHVRLSAPRNTLVLAHQEWTGAAWDRRELVLVDKGAVRRIDKLPKDFVIASGIAVAFDGDRVVFYDFASGEGGNYRRNIDVR